MLGNRGQWPRIEARFLHLKAGMLRWQCNTEGAIGVLCKALAATPPPFERIFCRYQMACDLLTLGGHDRLCESEKLLDAMFETTGDSSIFDDEQRAEYWECLDRLSGEIALTRLRTTRHDLGTYIIAQDAIVDHFCQVVHDFLDRSPFEGAYSEWMQAARTLNILVDSSRIEEALEIVERMLRAAVRLRPSLEGTQRHAFLEFVLGLLLLIHRLSPPSAKSCQDMLDGFLQSIDTSLEVLASAGFCSDYGWGHFLYGRFADAEEWQNRAIRVAQDRWSENWRLAEARYILMLAIGSQEGRQEEALGMRKTLQDELPDFARLESRIGSLEENLEWKALEEEVYNTAQRKLQMGESVLSEWFTANLKILIRAQRTYGLLPIRAQLARIKANENNAPTAATATSAQQGASTTSSRANGKGRRRLLPFRTSREPR